MSLKVSQISYWKFFFAWKIKNLTSIEVNCTAVSGSLYNEKNLHVSQVTSDDNLLYFGSLGGVDMY